jgi:hypothetical protein
MDEIRSVLGLCGLLPGKSGSQRIEVSYHPYRECKLIMDDSSIWSKCSAHLKGWHQRWQLMWSICTAAHRGRYQGRQLHARSQMGVANAKRTAGELPIWLVSCQQLF